MRLSTLILLAAALGCTPAAEPPAAQADQAQPDAGVSVSIGADGASVQSSGKDGTTVSVEVNADADKKKKKN